MQIEEIAEMISTPDGQMPAFLYRSVEHGQKPAVLLLMSDWKEDGRFAFFDSSSSDGSYGIIEKLVPNEFISFRHLGEIREGKEYPFDDGNRCENYALNEKDGITTLTLDTIFRKSTRVCLKRQLPRRLNE